MSDAIILLRLNCCYLLLLIGIGICAWEIRKRYREFRFSLRDLLILITLLAIPLGYVAHCLNWIGERHRMLTVVVDAPVQFVRGDVPGVGTQVSAPFPIGIFGERSIYYISAPTTDQALREKFKALFPEAILDHEPPQHREPPRQR